MIVQAAMTMLVLLGLSAFVVDYGVLWVSRAQAQNAADAGAVAGAVARAYDDPDSASPSGGIVPDSIREVVARNLVWTAPPSFAVFFACPPGAGYQCVKVDVHRDEDSGNPLPTFFGPVLGITQQSVRATATAQVAVGNGTTCLKPWAIPDKWIEASMPANDNFERYDGTGAILMNADVYNPPTAMDSGSGLTFPKSDPDPLNVGDLGLEITLSFPDPGPGSVDPIKQGFLLPLGLPGPNSYDENIAGCNGRFVEFGKEVETGAAAAATTDFTGLIDSDPGAWWNPATHNVEGSCAPGCGPVSPRLVALAVFDVDEYQFLRATGGTCSGGAHCVKVVNIVGLFLSRDPSGNVSGYIARYPGLLSPDNPTLSADSSFLPAITLVR